MPLSNFSNHNMTAPVQRRQIRPQREEKLRSNQPLSGAHHRQQSGFAVFDLRHRLALEVPLVLPLQHTPNRGSSLAGTSRIARLSNKSMLNRVEKIKVVVLQLAQLQKVQGRTGTFLQVQVHRDVADGRFDHYGHSAGFTSHAPIFTVLCSFAHQLDTIFHNFKTLRM